MQRIKAGLIFASIFFLTVAHAQGWPNKPIRLVVPYAAGGPTDILARQVASRMAAKLGQGVVIDNRLGAGGTIGVDFVLKAPPDGYTLALVAPGPVAGMQALTKVPYTLSEIQFITLIARSPSVISVNAKSGITRLSDLVSKAKSAPGQLNFSSAGNGTTPHIGSELFKQEAQIDVVHVAYKGSAPAVTALLSGEVQFILNDLIAVLPYVQAGKMNVLAVAGTRRVAQIPDVPTTAELGFPKVVMETNYGVIGPRGMPADVQKKIHDTLVEVINAPDMKDLMSQNGVLPVTSTAEEYRALMESENQKWRIVVSRGNIRLE